MSHEKNAKQYGTWPSPITPISLARGIGFSDIAWDQDGTLIWREVRSNRGVLVVQTPNRQAPRDLNSDYDVRAGVGYGGGDFNVGFGIVYFVDAKSGRIYSQPTHKGVAKPITPAFGHAACPTISPNGKYLMYVHSYERKDCLAVVDSKGENWPQKLVSGDDFYMQPCWHPDGQRIAWISWNHPQMPWDGTILNLAKVIDSSQSLPELGDVVQVTGGKNTAVFGAQFSPDGRYLAYVSDPDGWWHLYLYDLDNNKHIALTGGEAEHGIPAWVQGMRTFEFAPDGKSIYFLQNRDGFVGLWRVNIETKLQERVRIGSEYSWMTQIAVAPKGERVAVIASGGRIPNRIVSYAASEGVRILRRSLPEDLPEKTYALPSPTSWKGMDGEDVYGIFYAPRNNEFKGLGVPPLMVLIHGGPTSQRGASFDGQAQFFASRGWAVLQVNYRGSTGYGRAYRDQLKNNWGIYDVEDAISGAKSLVEDGQVDEDKLVIMGGSAGGFTVLKTMEDFPGFFKAGVNLFGVANQFTLVADTHKFEERYSELLLGKLPDAAEIYRERSPIFFTNKIKDPIIIFQGEDDRVVPKNQSDEIVAALRRSNVPHEYHLYPGEGHGFRKTETIEQFYTTLVKFLKTHVIYG
ncbi:prolyl oligopeptidase family serine peptidase [Chloroflexota bacterium]